MSVEEAILQMNLLDHQFYFFRNSENDNTHAVVTSAPQAAMV